MATTLAGPAAAGGPAAMPAIKATGEHPPIKVIPGEVIRGPVAAV